MTRDLSKNLKSQKKVEEESKSKFGSLQDSMQKQEKRCSGMVKLTATIEKEDMDYLQSEVLRRSLERGRILNISSVLREILHEHKR